MGSYWSYTLLLKPFFFYQIANNVEIEPSVLHIRHLALSSTWLVVNSQWNVRFHVHRTDRKFHFSSCESGDSFMRPHDITWKSDLYIYLAHWACQHIGCPPLCTWFLRWRHDFFHCHPGETRNCSNINTHSFHLHSYLPCKPIYDCTRETSQGSPPKVQVGQISSSIQSSQLIHCLFLNWVSHHTAINAMVIIWSGALLPLATELAQWCGHWNHRLMWPRISCYLWVDQLVCDAWDKTVLPSVLWTAWLYLLHYWGM